MIDRGRRLSIRISYDEADMLNALAMLKGLTVSDYVRSLVREIWAKKMGREPTPVSAAKSKRR